MYGVVMHEYMRDYFSEEFIFAYGNTKKEAGANAWEKLSIELDKDINELELNDNELTKTSFINYLISNENLDDGVLISEPAIIYVKLFKIPEEDSYGQTGNG